MFKIAFGYELINQATEFRLRALRTLGQTLILETTK